MKIINQNEKSDKYDKLREILKGLKNCIGKLCYFLKQILRIFQWIKNSPWLRWEQARLFLNQTKYSDIREVALNKNRLTLIFCNQ